jgi:hypothetical protein
MQCASNGRDGVLRKITEMWVGDHPIVVRGCRVSEPIRQPWGGACRIVEWVDGDGRISRRVVAEDVTAAQVRSTIARHVEGRKHVLHDDERGPRATLPRR